MFCLSFEGADTGELEEEEREEGRGGGKTGKEEETRGNGARKEEEGWAPTPVLDRPSTQTLEGPEAQAALSSGPF